MIGACRSGIAGGGLLQVLEPATEPPLAILNVGRNDREARFCYAVLE